MTKTVAAGDIHASGIVYDTTQRVSGGEIALGTVALDRELLDKQAGCVVRRAVFPTIIPRILQASLHLAIT